jgi:hypothetical protein
VISGLPYTWIGRIPPSKNPATAATWRSSRNTCVPRLAIGIDDSRRARVLAVTTSPNRVERSIVE